MGIVEGYVDVSEAGPSEDNVRLFNMSSPAPECIEANLKADGVFPRSTIQRS